MTVAILFKAIQEACLPAVWSQGISMSREGSFVQDVVGDEEVILRVMLKGRPVSPRVTLALKDQDWYCDCGGRQDPCVHVAASVIALKTGLVVSSATAAASEAPASAGIPAPEVPSISYRFRRVPDGLLFDRWLVVGEQETKIGYSLTSLVGGSQSGRSSGPPVSVTKADFAIDVILKARGSAAGALDPRTLRQLLGSLENCSSVWLDGQPVRTSTRPAGVRTRLIDEGAGFRIQRYQTTAGSERLARGVILEGGVIRPIEPTKLTPQEEDLLSQAGQYYPPESAVMLVTEILPALQKKTPVEILSERLPKVIEEAPRLILRLEKDGPEQLSVVANLVYGDPPIAQIQGERSELVPLRRDFRDVVQRDPGAEREHLQRLHRELNMQIGRRVAFQGEAAVRWVMGLKNWELTGDAVDTFRPRRVLEPRLVVNERDFSVVFESSSSSGAADPARVFRAWREGADYVPLMDGSWAPLPKDWFARYGKRLSDLLAAKEAQSDGIPPYRLPELAVLADELGAPCPESLQRLRRGFADFTGVPEAPLPSDLTATLRSYQRAGVNWLCFLRGAQLGGLLADDMGLGKTLQALCAIQGRTLVVAPTSVLYNWASEIQKFRPGLSVSVYYGSQRNLDSDAKVILTTYALLRLDQDRLCSSVWDTVILDEAQMIKNPDSQVARAAHRLRASFRLALSGTPVENHLDDLWSQFQFVNPGLLGTRENFQEEWVRPMARGEASVAERLRSKIKPFILRRLKRSVAPELPPRTETVLRCELDAPERELYDALLVSTRRDVLAKLESGGGVLAALEVILRLRQACCHRALVPGQQAESSSKVELLMETLEASIDQGHRSLIFSQWTSYLDLMETRLRERGIRWSRIDGSTSDRQAVVQEFQSDLGPPVMLVSLKAGGTGLTLTAADHIFIMDPWWNPAVEDQAADRAHRIGQQNPVLIHRIVAQDTIEERILLLQKKKMELANAVLEGGGSPLSLTRDDLFDLLRD